MSGKPRNPGEPIENLAIGKTIEVDGSRVNGRVTLQAMRNSKCERGVATYPLPQQMIYLTPKSELRRIYGNKTGPVIDLGEHVGSGGAPCFADMNELLGEHAAVLIRASEGLKPS